METGNTSAGYNAAIMAEALGNTGDAIEIMKKLVDNERSNGDYWGKAEYYLEQLVKNVADAELLEIYNDNKGTSKN
jgi:protein-L-isoaspartate O-methyltransferase